jgi:solute carrier family 35 (UDP-xylose/UDP-N-acetylglucosamine transporter), member B4
MGGVSLVPVLLGTLIVWVGCCMNVIVLELMLKEDRGGGNVISLVQFITIAIIYFPSNVQAGEIGPSVVVISSYCLHLL